jgi:hypothetical protein
VRVIDTFRTVLSLAYSPCGGYLYSAGWQHVSRWDVYSGDECEIHTDPAATYLRKVQLSPSGELVVWEDLLRRGVRGRYLPSANRQGMWEWPPRVVPNERATWTLLSNDALVQHSEPLATDRGGTVVAYRVGGRLFSAPLPRAGSSGTLLGQKAGFGGVLNARADLVSESSPDQFGFASADLLWWGSGRSFFLRDMPNGPVRRLDNLDRLPTAVTPNGRTGIATDYRHVLLIDLPSGLIRERFDWEVGMVEAVAVAPDGMTAAVAGWAGGIAIFDLDG